MNNRRSTGTLYHEADQFSDFNKQVLTVQCTVHYHSKVWGPLD